MTPETMLTVAADAAQAVLAARDGDPIQAARHAISAALTLVPKEMAEQLLTDEAVRRANAIADLMEREKFG